MHSAVLRTFSFLLLLQSAWLISGCGSGGGGGSSLPVLPPVPVVPDFSVQPAPVSVVAGQAATFSAAASGSPTYQWLKAGTPIAGAIEATYTLQANLGDDGTQFSVTASNPAGSRTSQAVRLSVTPAPVQPSFARGPSAVSVEAGTTATFEVEMAGSSPFAYQWYRDGVAIAEANQPRYSLSATPADNNAQFSVQVTNVAGSVTSAAATLRVSAQFIPVSITVEPLDVTVRNGDPAAFAVSVEGTAPFALRWLVNGAETGLGGPEFFTNNFRYVISSVQLSDDGSLIGLRITDSRGRTVFTRSAKLTVLP